MNLTYTTKCRICGTLEEWYFAPARSVNWVDFATAMQDNVDHARLKHCESCKMQTVQDCVAYTPYDPKHFKKMKYPLCK